MDKNIKLILREYTEEVKRHNSVLKEDLDSSVQTIAEQYDSINKKLDSHAEMIGGIKEDIEVIKMDMGLVKNSLTLDSFKISNILRSTADNRWQ